MFKISTGLNALILGTTGLRGALTGGVLKIYAGAEPVTADAALSGATLLCTVSNNDSGTGLSFSAPAAGALAKSVSEVWKGTNEASGTPSFYRFTTLADTGGASTTEARAQGSAGAAGSDLFLTVIPMIGSAEQIIDYFEIALPPT